MARAAVKAKQRAQAPAQPARGVRGPRGRRRHSGGGNPNQQLFFSRLRRQAKWMYVLLAVLFAVTFAALGVGSGSNSGLDQLFSGLNIFGGGGGDSISKAQHEIKDHPQAAKGYRDLATAYEQKGDVVGAIGALQQYTAIRKSDASAFSELGGLQFSQAQTFAAQYQQAAAAAQAASPGQSFLPTGTFGTAIGTNPIEQAASQSSNGVVGNLYQQAILDFDAAIQSYQTAARLQPHDASAAVQVATAARAAGQYPVAVTALKTFLKANPQSSERAQLQSLIRQLTPAPTKPTKPAKKGK